MAVWEAVAGLVCPLGCQLLITDLYDQKKTAII